MKNSIFTIALIVLISLIGEITLAQTTNKEMKSKLKFKPTKEVRKQAKEYEKQGYHVAVGAPSIERQLTDSWIKDTEKDDDGNRLYFIGTGNSVGETQTAAKIQSTEVAKLDIAGQIGTQVAALVENNLANSQLNTEDASSVTQTVAASKSMIAQTLGRVETLTEFYKDGDKTIEADVILGYNYEHAMKEAKAIVRKNLVEKTDILQDELDTILDF